MTRTFRTLLSGGELFGVGARAAGYVHLDGYEIDGAIAAVARRNGFDVRTADICEVDYSALPPADHLHASTVCTRASQANVGAEEAPEDLAMADAVCRAIAAHQGRTFSLENVWAYRRFESFDRICAALRTAGFVLDIRHVNAADYGVPQTRKRLILRAVRGRDRVPPLHPTHRKGGDMFHPPWVGWYAAIADIIDTLPETQPAPWQLARMPKELRESTLFPSRMSHDQQGNCYGPQSRSADEPAQTIATMTPGWYKAFLMGVQSAGHGVGVQIADADAPAFTVRASDHHILFRAYLVNGQNAGQEWSSGYTPDDDPAPTVSNSTKGAPRAFIVGGGNTQLGQVDSRARRDDEPMFTVSASDGARKTAAAYLLAGTKSPHGNNLVLRAEDEPATTVVSAEGDRIVTRAHLAGRWVRMTIQALGRFQTVPDDYQSLTAQINGNGVPCLEAQRIMESFDP